MSQGNRQKFARLFRRSSRERSVFVGISGSWVGFWTSSFRGPRNGAFGEPCPCPRDTRHFRHFRRFTGFEQQSPCFIGWNADSSFSPFSSKTPFFLRDKSTVDQKHRFRDPEVFLHRRSHIMLHVIARKDAMIQPEEPKVQILK